MLYTHSSELHKKSYEKLIGMHSSDIEWVFETESFAYHYKYILDDMEEDDYIFLLCDDDVIYREIDINFCTQFLDDHLVFSTRLGENALVNVVAKSDQHIPKSAYKIYGRYPLSKDHFVYSWNWDSEDAVVDYAYPLAVNNMIFKVSVYRNILYVIISRNPKNANYLEGYLQEYLKLQPLYYNDKNRRMCCYQQSKSYNSWLNAVQDNPSIDFSNELSAEEAVINFMNNKILDIDSSNVNGSCIEVPYGWVSNA